MPEQNPDYIQSVHSILQEASGGGFKLGAEEFAEKLQNDDAYSDQVYQILNEASNGGLKISLEDFKGRVKKKDSGQQQSNDFAFPLPGSEKDAQSGLPGPVKERNSGSKALLLSEQSGTIAEKRRRLANNLRLPSDEEIENMSDRDIEIAKEQSEQYYQDYEDKIERERLQDERIATSTGAELNAFEDDEEGAEALISEFENLHKKVIQNSPQSVKTTPEELDRYNEIKDDAERLIDVKKKRTEQQFYAQQKLAEPTKGNVDIYNDYLQTYQPDLYEAYQSQKEQGELTDMAAAKHHEKAIKFSSGALKNTYSQIENRLGSDYMRTIQNLEEHVEEVTNQLRSLSDQHEAETDPEKKAAIQEAFNNLAIDSEIKNSQAQLQQMISNPEFQKLAAVGGQMQQLKDEAENYVRQYPEYQEYLEWTQEEQAKRDLEYRASGWLKQTRMDISTAAMGTLGKAVQDVMTLPRTLSQDNEYGWTDKLAQDTEEFFEYYDTVYSMAPTKHQRGLVENVVDVNGYQVVLDDDDTVVSVRDKEGYQVGQELSDTIIAEYNETPEKYESSRKVNYDTMFPKVLQLTGDMGVMFLGAGKFSGGLKALGAKQSIAQSAGLTATVMAQTHNQAYQDGIDNGLSPMEASRYAISVSGAIAMVAQVNPQYYVFGKGSTKKLLEKYARSYFSNKKDRVAAAKFVMKEGLKEAAEEGPIETTAENIVGAAANVLTEGRSNFDTTYSLNELIESSTLGLVGGAGFSPLGMKSRSRLNQEALHAALFNDVDFNAVIDKYVGKEVFQNEDKIVFTQEMADSFKAEVDALRQRVGSIAEAKELTTEEEIQVTTIESQKMEYEKRLQNDNINPNVEQLYNSRIKELDNKIGLILGREDAAPYYEIDGEVLTSEEFSQLFVDEEFLNRLKNSDVDFRIHNDMDAVNTFNEIMQSGVAPQPGETVAQPGETVTEPGETVTEPGETVTEPGETVTEPGETVTEPGETVTEPGETVTEPGETVAQPGETVTEPGETVTEPGETVTEPGETVTEPGETVTEPGETVTEPGETVTEPGETVTEPGETVPKPKGKKKKAAPKKKPKPPKKSSPKEAKPIYKSTDGKYELVQTEDGIQVKNKKSGVISKRNKYIKVLTDEYLKEQRDNHKDSPVIEGNPDPARFAKDVADNSNNPIEIAQTYISEKERRSEETERTKEQLIAENIGRIKTSQFNKYGDRNWSTRQIRLNYLSEKSGSNLDEIAFKLKEEGEFSGMDSDDIIQEILQFVLDHPGGTKSYFKESPIEADLKAAFFEATGAELTPERAKLMTESESTPEPEKPKKDSKKKPNKAKPENPFEEDPNEEVDDELTIPTEQDEEFELVEEEGDAPFQEDKSGRGKKTPAKKSSRKKTTKKKGRKPYNDSTKKGEAEIIGADNDYNESPGRIQPTPLNDGTEVKSIKDILVDIGKGVGRKITYHKRTSKSRNAIGTYYSNSAATRVRYKGDMDTSAHELGHALDDKFKILDEVLKGDVFGMEGELLKFAKYGSKPPKGLPPELQREYELGEGVAEWIRAYVVNPEQAIKDAPQFYKHYQEVVSKEAKSAIKEFSNDVRRWFASSTGGSEMRSNIKFEPEKGEGFVKSFFNKDAYGDGFAMTWADKMAAKWTNSFRPYEAAINHAKGEKGITDLIPENDPEMMARLYLGINSKFDDMFTRGLRDARGRRLVDPETGERMSIKWLLGAVNAETNKKIKAEMKMTMQMMVAQRALELPDKFAKRQASEDIEAGILPPDEVLEKYPDLYTKYAEEIESLMEADVKRASKKRYDFTKIPLTGSGGGIMSDYMQESLNLQKIEELRKVDPEKVARMEETARRYRTYADHIMQYMVDKGRMSQEQYDLIKETNQQYVAMNRVIEIAPGETVEVYNKSKSGKLGVTSEVIHGIKGATDIIENPMHNLLEYAAKAVKESDRNDVMRAFTELITNPRGIRDGDPKYLASIGQKVLEPEDNTITVYNNGVKEHWRFEKDVYESLKGLDDLGFRFPGFITALPKLLRWTVTNFPVFAARNFTRDTIARVVLTRTKSGLRDLRGSKEDLENYEALGGGQAGYYARDDVEWNKMLKSAMNDLSKKKNFILFDGFRLKDVAYDKGYRKFIEGAETANRLAEYRSAFKRAKEQGMDDYNAGLYAAFQARDLLDFAVAGTYMRVINQVIPFSNAAVQGVKRAFISAQEDPKGFTARWALYSLVPGLMVRSLVSLLDEDEAYAEIPDWQKDLFYNIPLGNNTWITIPKPFELGVLATSGERMIDRMMGNEEAFDGYAGSVFHSTIPLDAAWIYGPLKSPIEIMTNYDTFRKKAIIPTHEEGLRVSHPNRRTDRASRLAKAGQALGGLVGADIDPRYIDHFIKGNFSYFGKFGIKLSDIGREDSSQNEFHWGDLGFFKQDPAYNSKSVQWVLKTAKEEALLQDPDYKGLNDLIGYYFDSPTAEEKSKRAEVLRQYARDVKRAWQPFLEQKRAEEKILKENKR